LEIFYKSLEVTKGTGIDLNELEVTPKALKLNGSHLICSKINWKSLEVTGIPPNTNKSP
jgi:hypothetical protein